MQVFRRASQRLSNCKSGLSLLARVAKPLPLFISMGFMLKSSPFQTQSQNPNDMDKAVPQEFTYEKYQQVNMINAYQFQYLKEKKGVIIIVNYNSYNSRGRSMILDELQFIQSIKTKGGNLVEVLFVDFKDASQKKEFESKMNVYVKQDTILLLKNKYSENFFQQNILLRHNLQYPDNTTFIYQYFKKIYSINSSLSEKFLKQLVKLTNEDKFMLIKYNSKNIDIKRKIKDLHVRHSFRQDDDFKFILIKDNSVFERLNIQNPKEGDLYLVEKSTINNLQKSNLEMDNKSFNVFFAGNMIKNKNYLEDFALEYQNEHIFQCPKFLGLTFKRYVLQVQMDKNKISSKEKKQLLNIIKNVKIKNQELASKFQFQIKQKHMDSNCQLMVQDMDKQEVQYYFNLRYSQSAFKSLEDIDMSESKKKIISDPHTFEYKYQSDQPKYKEIIDFMERVVEEKEPEFFVTQDPPNYRKYSQKVVGQTFPQIFESIKHSAVFYYSKHCHACKSYGGIYENLALKNVDSDKMDFYRFNSSQNNTKQNFLQSLLKNYLYTPIFMVMRREDKSKPYIYRASYMNRKLLEDFINITSSFVVQDREIYELAQQKRENFVNQK